MKNFKKKLAARGGFTLVELIVVIAILAILAGVGTAAYSGYITKANEAVDKELVASINTAVAAAAAGQGLDAKDVTVTGTISNGTATITISHSTSSVQTGLQSDLALFLNGTYNNGVTVSGFKYYKSLSWANGVLTGSATAPAVNGV